MKTIESEYVEDFRCNPIVCKAKCCNNDIIEVDSKTLSKFKHLKPPAKSKEILKKLVKNRVAFKDGFCPFFNENTFLCSLWEEFNEDFIPEKCRTYPYNIINLGDIFVRTLALSCPVACNLIIGRENPANTIENNINMKNDLTVAEKSTSAAEFLPIFQNCATQILKNTDYPMEERLFLTKAYIENAENIKSPEELATFSENFINDSANFINNFKSAANKEYLEEMISILSKFYDKGGILTTSSTVGFTLFADVVFNLPKVTDPSRSYDMEKMLKLYEERFIPAKEKLYKEYEKELSNYAAYLFVSNLIPFFPENTDYKSSVKYFKLLFDFSVFILTSVLYTLNAEFDGTTFKMIVGDLSTIWEEEGKAKDFLREKSL